MAYWNVEKVFSRSRSAFALDRSRSAFALVELARGCDTTEREAVRLQVSKVQGM